MNGDLADMARASEGFAATGLCRCPICAAAPLAMSWVCSKLKFAVQHSGVMGRKDMKQIT